MDNKKRTRRSSILKRRSRSISPDRSPPKNPKPRLSRRISFSGRNAVREFAISEQKDTIWLASYEEPTELIEFKNQINRGGVSTNVSSFNFENSMNLAEASKRQSNLGNAFQSTYNPHANREKLTDIENAMMNASSVGATALPSSRQTVIRKSPKKQQWDNTIDQSMSLSFITPDFSQNLESTAIDIPNGRKTILKPMFMENSSVSTISNDSPITHVSFKTTPSLNIFKKMLSQEPQDQQMAPDTDHIQMDISSSKQDVGTFNTLDVTKPRSNGTKLFTEDLEMTTMNVNKSSRVAFAEVVVTEKSTTSAAQSRESISFFEGELMKLRERHKTRPSENIVPERTNNMITHSDIEISDTDEKSRYIGAIPKERTIQFEQSMDMTTALSTRAAMNETNYHNPNKSNSDPVRGGHSVIFENAQKENLPFEKTVHQKMELESSSIDSWGIRDENDTFLKHEQACLSINMGTPSHKTMFPDATINESMQFSRMENTRRNADLSRHGNTLNELEASNTGFPMIPMARLIGPSKIKKPSLKLFKKQMEQAEETPKDRTTAEKTVYYGNEIIDENKDDFIECSNTLNLTSAQSKRKSFRKQLAEDESLHISHDLRPTKKLANHSNRQTICNNQTINVSTDHLRPVAKSGDETKRLGAVSKKRETILANETIDEELFCEPSFQIDKENMEAHSSKYLKHLPTSRTLENAEETLHVPETQSQTLSNRRSFPRSFHQNETVDESIHQVIEDANKTKYSPSNYMSHSNANVERNTNTILMSQSFDNSMEIAATQIQQAPAKKKLTRQTVYYENTIDETVHPFGGSIEHTLVNKNPDQSRKIENSNTLVMHQGLDSSLEIAATQSEHILKENVLRRPSVHQNQNMAVSYAMDMEETINKNTLSPPKSEQSKSNLHVNDIQKTRNTILMHQSIDISSEIRVTQTPPITKENVSKRQTVHHNLTIDESALEVGDKIEHVLEVTQNNYTLRTENRNTILMHQKLPESFYEIPATQYQETNKPTTSSRRQTVYQNQNIDASIAMEIINDQNESKPFSPKKQHHSQSNMQMADGQKNRSTVLKHQFLENSLEVPATQAQQIITQNASKRQTDYQNQTIDETAHPIEGHFKDELSCTSMHQSSDISMEIPTTQYQETTKPTISSRRQTVHQNQSIDESIAMEIIKDQNESKPLSPQKQSNIKITDGQKNRNTVLMDQSLENSMEGGATQSQQILTKNKSKRQTVYQNQSINETVHPDKAHFEVVPRSTPRTNLNKTNQNQINRSTNRNINPMHQSPDSPLEIPPTQLQHINKKYTSRQTVNENQNLDASCYLMPYPEDECKSPAIETDRRSAHTKQSTVKDMPETEWTTLQSNNTFSNFRKEFIDMTAIKDDNIDDIELNLIESNESDVIDLCDTKSFYDESRNNKPASLNYDDILVGSNINLLSKSAPKTSVAIKQEEKSTYKSLNDLRNKPSTSTGKYYFEGNKNVAVNQSLADESMLPALPRKKAADFKLDFSGYDQFKGVLMPLQICRRFLEQRELEKRLEESKMHDLETTMDDPRSQNVEAPSLKFLYENKFAMDTEEAIRLAEQTHAEKPIIPFLPASSEFYFMLKNKIDNLEHWRHADSHHLYSGRIVLRHNYMVILILVLTFEPKKEQILSCLDLYDKVLFKEVYVKRSNLMPRNMPTHYKMGFNELMSKLPKDLRICCTSTTEITLFLDYLQDKIRDAMHKVFAIMELVMEEDYVILEEDEMPYIRIRLFNFERSSFQDILISLEDIDSTSTAQVKTIPCQNFHDDIYTLRRGMEFVTAILRDPRRYINITDQE